MTLSKIRKETAEAQTELLSILSDTIKLAKSKVDQVEASINQMTGIDVSSRWREVENVNFNHEGALGITVYHQHKKGNASTNDLSQEGIARTLEKAIAIMQLTSADPYSGLADRDLLAFDSLELDLFHPNELDVDKAIEEAILLESSALDYPEITQSNGGHCSHTHNIFAYANSEGVLQSYCSSYHSKSVSIVAEKQGKMVSDYAYSSSRDSAMLQNAHSLGKEAASKAISHLGAKTVSTMQVPVIFSAEIASSFFGYLASAINGNAIYKKSSFLLDKLDSMIFPEWFSIIERPHLLKGLASAPFDNQGVKTGDMDIIESGLLKNYLLGSYSARKLSAQSGHSFRSNGHAGGIYNWLIECSKPLLPFDDLVKTMDKGIIVTSLMGQGVNLINGDYSRGAEGFWVENGVIQYPIHEFTVAGNLQQMFRDIIALGNDINRQKTIQTGSVLIDSMKIAGL